MCVCVCVCVCVWKSGVATWARDIPKFGFGHQEESNTDSSTKRRGLWRPGGKRQGPWRFPLSPKESPFPTDLRPCGPSNLS